MSRPPTRPARVQLVATYGPLALVLAVVAALAVALQRNGIGWGDDFALYLRQARSVIDGNIGQVVADNRFNVDNAAEPGFSPYVYPWGWPLLLAPFLRAWGLDYGRLKLVEVACLCGFLAFFHQIVRHRTADRASVGRWVALGVVAFVGSTLAYLRHTDGLLSEYPYMFAVAGTLWWLDRCRRGSPVISATRTQLVTLGLLCVLVFNIRREGLAMVAAILAVQVVELVSSRRGQGRRTAVSWRSIATPHLTFVVGVVAAQLLLPSALAPAYEGAGLHETWSKLRGSFRVAFGDQLGFPGLHGPGMWLAILLVAAGITVRMWRAAADDVALLVFAVLSMTLVGLIPAVADRYLLAITPFAVYFAVQAVAAVPLPRHGGLVVAGLLLVVFTTLHLRDLPDPIRAVQRANDVGVIDGPAADDALAGFAAVDANTHQDDVVAFFKARALTFYTDRRAVQSSDLEVVRQRSDFFLMRRDSSFSQPLVTDEQAARMGWTEVWSDDTWVLWRLPRLA